MIFIFYMFFGKEKVVGLPYLVGIHVMHYPQERGQVTTCMHPEVRTTITRLHASRLSIT